MNRRIIFWKNVACYLNIKNGNNEIGIIQPQMTQAVLNNCTWRHCWLISLANVQENSCECGNGEKIR